jgi:HEAT repeat protein
MVAIVLRAGFVGLCVGLFLPLVQAAGDDPEYEGMKVSKWVDTVQNASSARQRALAVEALGKIWVLHKHKDAIPNICRSLRVDPSAAVRAQAAVVLSGLRAEDLPLFSKDLVGALENEKESRVRRQIISAMTKFPETCVLGIEALISALKDDDPAVKVAAAEALALAAITVKGSAKSAASELAPLLKEKDKAVRMAAIYAIARIEPEGASTIAETLATMLQSEGAEADVKREIVTSIGLLSQKSGVVVNALAKALSDPDDEVRRRAARVLGTFGTAASTAADDLFKVITDEKLTDIRVDAVRAFGSALGPAGLKARIRTLLPHLTPEVQPAWEVRLAVVDEIGSLGWEFLGSDLTSPQPETKAAALEVMASLRKRLADPQIQVREAAAVAVRKIEKKPEPKKEPEKKEP